MIVTGLSIEPYGTSVRSREFLQDLQIQPWSHPDVLLPRPSPRAYPHYDAFTINRSTSHLVQYIYTCLLVVRSGKYLAYVQYRH